MIDVIDALMLLLEPGGSIDPTNSLRTTTSGVIAVHTAARPPQPEMTPNHLYCYPVADRHVTIGAGDPPDEREEFTVEALLVVDREDEEPKLTARRDVSSTLDTKAHAYLAAVNANRPRNGAVAPWEYLTSASVDWDRLRSFAVRGVPLRVSGWRNTEGGA